MGDAGPYVTSILHAHATGDSDAVAKYAGKLLDLTQLVLSEVGERNEDEVLYGNAGYLYALLLVRKRVPGAGIPDEVLGQVTDAIMRHGTKLAASEPSLASPLLYSFGKRYYMGAAHGLTGVVYMLLCCVELLDSGGNLDLLKLCVDYILACRLTSGT